MNREEVINFANDNPICYIATIENGKPHARLMKLWHADHTGFYFETLSPKDITRQLHDNPNVEVCFFNHSVNRGEGREMRVSGEIEFVTNKSIIHRAKHANHLLGNVGNEDVGMYIEVFKLAHGDVKFWDLKTSVLFDSVENHMFF